MKQFYRITVRISFGLMAESQKEAEAMASEIMADAGQAPTCADVDIDAYLTPNQSDDIRRQAINYDSE